MACDARWVSAADAANDGAARRRNCPRDPRQVAVLVEDHYQLVRGQALPAGPLGIGDPEYASHHCTSRPVNQPAASRLLRASSTVR
jgi:hypothetical protein